MSLRVFAALGLPPAVRDRLSALQRGVPGAAWRPAENFHITLRFFGEVDEPLAEELDAHLGAISSPPFDLTLKGAGWFGGVDPQSLWLGVNGGAALETLAGQCERAARRAGLPPERRKYTPHVTLAYCQGTGHDDAARFVQRHAMTRIGPIEIDRFHLYSSWMGKGPSRYVEEAEYPLMGGGW